jgi:PPOX class probable FMN-dependent enzyme
MGDSNGHRIETVEQLRAVIGELNPVVQVKLMTELDEYARDFIGRSPFLVLSTSDAQGHQDVSPKGDAPGFVAVENPTTLLIPDRKGNRLIFGLQNILSHPRVGLLFMVPGTGETLRVNGRAELIDAPETLERLSTRGQPALLAIRVTIDECFFHCAKAFIRAQLWKPETWPAAYRVSFGKMLAPKVGGDQQIAEAIDQAIAEDYRSGL